MSLQAKDIVFSYQEEGEPVLNRVSLEVGSQERIGVTAPSGYREDYADEDYRGYMQPDSDRSCWMAARFPEERILSGTDDLAAS